ncbi:MAG: anthranilate synthase component I [Prochloraceae cyanobacterium]|nr:anthranilate synthase component I [Prochloraceae cyanobacterium]
MSLPWYWRSLRNENRSGKEIFELLFRQQGTIATLLESPVLNSHEQSHLSRYSICAGSPRIVDGKLRLWTPQLGEILPFLRSLLKTESTNNIDEPTHLPFTGGWLGWLGYDLAKEIEKLPRQKSPDRRRSLCDSLPFPLAYWYEPESFAILDRAEKTLWLAATTETKLDRLQHQLESKLIPPLSPSPPLPLPPSPNSFLTSQEDYENAVRQAKKYIQAGDIFQANLSVRFQVSTTAESWDIYCALQAINPSPFASYWKTPWGDVISCSPERLVQLQGRTAQTRPIAGTRKRGITPEFDRNLAEELITNVKERAEHIMLVDLERNDLGKVCQWGSVEVDELLTIERYSHVMHLVSNVCGTLKPECDGVDLIRAVFPGGTITGCPKVRCMEIIEQLESVPRNLFYGSCGYLDRRGNLDLNILIRTLLYSHYSPEKSLVWGQVGAGIVADSDPEQEWYESLNKAEAQLAALRYGIRS